MIMHPVPELFRERMPNPTPMSSVKNKGGRPLLEDVPRRNEHLLDIATEVFVRQGYNATTLDRIAAEAGVAKRTIYARYTDKQALFFAVMRRLSERRVFENLWAKTSCHSARGSGAGPI
jgi:AcrR family transcriptional regulator